MPLTARASLIPPPVILHEVAGEAFQDIEHLPPLLTVCSAFSREPPQVDPEQPLNPVPVCVTRSETAGQDESDGLGIGQDAPQAPKPEFLIPQLFEADSQGHCGVGLINPGGVGILVPNPSLI